MVFQHQSLKYCIPLVKDQNSVYEIRSVAIYINIETFKRVSRKQLDILKTFWNVWKIILLLTEEGSTLKVFNKLRSGVQLLINRLLLIRRKQCNKLEETHFLKSDYSVPLNKCDWWGCCGDKIWAINLNRSNFVAEGGKCDRRGGNQAVKNVWVKVDKKLKFLEDDKCF